MMATSALMLLQATAPANAAEAEDVAVIARRLEGVETTVQRDARGKFRCALNKSTGLAALDRQLCKVTTDCVRKGFADEAISRCIEASKPVLTGPGAMAFTRTPLSASSSATDLVSPATACLLAA